MPSIRLGMFRSLFEGAGLYCMFHIPVDLIMVFDIHNNELDDMKKLIQDEMQNAYKMSVPLDVEVGISKNWLEAH